ncbi:MAG: PEP-CTERM sorting domain-containing protein [candidate division Zixibacteria bacterium]|nr:PEP-CTERM sorting domain-containing protein [candidate division Zixibacteria bacterium]
MKANIFRFLGCTAIMVVLLIATPILIDLAAPQFSGIEQNTAYALGKRGHRRHDAQRNPVPSNPVSVPEPSTLVLLGTGLVAGGGLYSILKHRKKSKKS